jgi:enterobactin synthetase component D
MHAGKATILPRPAYQCRLFLERALPPEVGSITLPPDLERAFPGRQLHFRAGRYCAMRAMASLDPRFKGCQVGRAQNGAPLWPEGTTGSITHTDGFASAAVALTTDMESLGIDTERIVSESQAREIASLVTSLEESSHARAAGLSEPTAFTLVFSAKESIFKCLHPITGEFMDFHDVRIEHVDVNSRTFSARLARALSPRFPLHATLHGCFEIDAPWVHTGLALPPKRDTWANDHGRAYATGNRTLA